MMRWTGLVEVCRERAAGSSLEVAGAAEGVTVELPEQEGYVEPPEPENGVEQSGHHKASDGRRDRNPTVLIVDDDPDVLQLLHNTLEPEGFRLTLALNGEAALELARAERPRLILLDAEMDGMDGLEVCRTIRAEKDAGLADVPVVLLTSQGGAEFIDAGFRAGVTDYVVKPLMPPHIRTRVRTWLIRTHRDRESEPATRRA